MAVFEININEKISNVIIGESVKRGDLLYLHNDSKWYKANATTKTRSTTELMLALEDGDEDDQIDLLHYGYFDYGDAVIDPNAKYYVSASDGQITKTVYEAEGYVIRYIGTGFTNNVLLFNPDQTYISDNNTKINEVTISGTGGGGSGVFENNIIVSLGGGKTVGKYGNGDEIPSAGMTFEQFANDIAREYLKPQLSNFKNNIPGIVEVGTTLSGSVPFSWNYSQRNGDIQEVRIIDLEVGANHELATVPNSSPKNATLTTRLLSAHLLTQRWVLKGLDVNQGSDITTAPYEIQSQYYVFFGAVDSFPSNPSDGAANRTYAMNMTNKSSASKRFANQGPFTMHTLTTKRKYVILCPPGSTITRIEDTGNLNLDVKPSGYTDSPITIKDANGTDRSYTMWKADNQDDYSDDATHVIFITTP